MATRRSTLKRSLRAIEGAFAEIERSLAQLSRRIRRAERASRSRAVGRAATRSLRITPARRAQLKLQGAYMGYMRQLAPRQKAAIKAIKEKRGFEAAIKAARTIAKG